LSAACRFNRRKGRGGRIAAKRSALTRSSPIFISSVNELTHNLDPTVPPLAWTVGNPDPEFGAIKMVDIVGMEGGTRAGREIDTGAIADERFINQLNQLRKLKQFLYEEKIQFKKEDLAQIDLEKLNNLSYARNGRVPGANEWRTLDEKLFILAGYLNDDLRRKLRIRELGFFFRTLPIGFLACSVLSTIAYINVPWITNEGSPWKLLIWLIFTMSWLISQGGLGACAFLGTSVIFRVEKNKGSAEGADDRENIDVTDRNSLSIRVLLGTLFAVLLGLPYAVVSLNGLSDVYWKGQPPSEATLAVIFIPFVAGFSTNLVLVILRKFVLAIETFFGLPSRA
jgi:hypothetical protein